MLHCTDSGNQRDGSTQRTACADWGALLPDAAEDLLGEAETRALGMHIKGCAGCAAELAEARRGAAWLTLLKEHTPEPPRDMVASILARTTGDPSLSHAMAEPSAPLAPATGTIPGISPEALPPWLTPARSAGASDVPSPTWSRVSRWLGLEARYLPALHPRLTMTAAMAFLSICLTLNLLGVSVTHLQAQELQTSNLQRAVEGKGETLLHSLGGLRVVYRVESRVNGWLMANATQGSAPDATRLRQ